jgi:hypothetical protein
MPLLADAKQFVREMVEALDVSLDQIAGRNQGEQLFLTSEVIGSCDALTGLLIFFGESVPGMRKFAGTGRQKLAKIRADARKLRSDAYRAVCDADESAAVASPPEAEVIPEAVDDDASEVTPIGGANGQQQ